MRILVVNNLYPPPARGGYEVECMGVVEHLRSTHHVEVLTSTAGGAAEETGIHRRLPLPERHRIDTVLAPVHSVRAVVRTQEVLDGFRPELVLVFNGSTIPQAAIRQLSLSGAMLAVRVCEHWFGRLYASDRFMSNLAPGQHAGLRGVWARGMRIVDRVHPRLRTRTRPRRPWAVSWNSDFMRTATRVPDSVEIVYEDTYVPANPRVPRFAEVERRPHDGEPEIFFAGRLDELKGADVLLRALASLRDRHGVAARLVLAGDGTRRQREELEALAADLDVRERVAFPGQLDFDGMAERLATAAAWVVPSVWNEPAPTVALEAGLARVPAVMSRVGGAPEMLREGTEALFFARGDHDGCADALQDLLTNRTATDARVARAHARAVSLGWDVYLRRTDSFLEGAVTALRKHVPVRA